MKPSNTKLELTPVQRFGRAIILMENIFDAIGVLLLLLALGLYYLGVSEMAIPEKSYTPYLAHIFPALAETDQITVCASQLVGGALLVLLGILVLFRTRLHRLN